MPMDESLYNMIKATYINFPPEIPGNEVAPDYYQGFGYKGWSIYKGAQKCPLCDGLGKVIINDLNSCRGVVLWL